MSTAMIYAGGTLINMYTIVRKMLANLQICSHDGCLQSLDWTGLDYWTLPKIESLSIYQHLRCICAINKWCL